ncbi:MAG: YigZ family protein [Bacteroidales bacterium]|nr:YigZ family protein [Bacteroidales bacterium]HOY39595.1 YigZ family protein [Bacteroidales bacterium]HQP05185.1 YigZ family protein [Bacteroidales bacterium]
MDKDAYHSIREKTQGYFRDRGSKFLSFAFPVSCDEDVKNILNQLRKEYYDANHHVYAYRLGVDENNYRSSDDGEPANSSGKPVLGQILSYGLSDVLVVVIRYFGGVKLGVPGLIHAYRTAADDALKSADIIEKLVQRTICVEFPYSLMNQVLRLVEEEHAEVFSRDFTEDCRLSFRVRKSHYKDVSIKLNQIFGVKIISDED